MLQGLIHKPDVLMGCDRQICLFTFTKTINCTKPTRRSRQPFFILANKKSVAMVPEAY